MRPLAEKAIRRLKEIHKPEIDRRLERALEREKELVPGNNELFFDAIDKLMDFTLRGGKRLRPAFVVEGYRAAGGKDLDAAYDASLAMEGSETYLLIHDDIIDEDPLRRGKPTMHMMYLENLKRYRLDSKKARHLAEGLALVIGDVQATINYDWVLNANFPVDVKIKAIRKFNEILRMTCYGQILDIMSETRPVEEVTEGDVLLVHSLKTSAYTIYGPLQIGGILAGAGKEILDTYYNYGHPLGIAFQLQDDILGLFGDTKKTGKPAHSDLKEGKRTLLIIKALENGTQEQRKRLLEILGKRDLTDEEAEEAREIVRETGSLDYSREMARRLAEEGISAVEEADLEEEGEEYLIGIAEFLIDREV